MVFELDEIIAEHRNEPARGLVELRLVLPRLERVEQMRLDTRYRTRHREAEIGVGAERSMSKRAVERGSEQRACHLDRHASPDPVFAAGPAGIDKPTIDIVDSDQFTQQIAVFGGV